MLLRRPTGAITVVCVTVWVDPEKPLSWPLASGLTLGTYVLRLCHYPRPMSAIRTKRTSPSALHMSAFDPRRTLTLLDLGPTRLPKLSYQ